MMPAPSATTYEIDVQMTLRDDLARKLMAAAKKRCVQPVNLLAQVVETVLRDDLVDAVIDI